MRKTEENGLNGRKEGWAGVNIAPVSFRQLPSASADFLGHPRHVWTEDGRWKLGNYEGKQRKIGLNGRNQGGVGEIWHPSASVSFRRLPRTSAACVDGRWKLGNYEDKQRKIGINGSNQGEMREISLLSASAGFCGRPWTSAACVGGRWKMRSVKL